MPRCPDRRLRLAEAEAEAEPSPVEPRATPSVSGERGAGERGDDPDRAGAKQRHHHAAPQGKQGDRRGGQHRELPGPPARPVSGSAAPRIAPIAAGPAPARNAVRVVARRRSRRLPPRRTNANDGAKATARPGDHRRAPRGVADGGHRRTTGPGVIWPSATALRNWLLVIQW